MPTLRRGTRIALTDGSTVTVGRFLGAGGQGEVYAATDNDGNDKALKWFTNPSLLADSRFAASMAARCLMAAGAHRSIRERLRLYYAS